MPGNLNDMNYQLYFNDNQQTCYVAGTTYEWDYGRIQQAVCGPLGTPTEILRVHGGKAQKVVVWVAESLSGQPAAPSHDTVSSNEVLLSKRVGVATPGVVLSGDQTWCLWGEYRYALVKMPSDTDSLSGGGSPEDQSSATMNVANPTFFQQFLGPAAPVSGNGPWGQITGGASGGGVAP